MRWYLNFNAEDANLLVLNRKRREKRCNRLCRTGRNLVCMLFAYCTLFVQSANKYLQYQESYDNIFPIFTLAYCTVTH